MASAPQSNLPMLYNDLVPLSSQEHGSWKARPMANLEMIREAHAIPVTIDEFVMAQRFHPIVFSSGEDAVPLALFGLNEGVNAHMDDEGVLAPDTYLPAYVRRYPFMLVRLQEGSDELSLCFDPTRELIGDFEEGVALFKDGEPSDETKATLEFCEQFEIGAQKTGAFVAELKQLGLLIDGELTIQQPGIDAPFVYRGFQMVDENKLRDLRGDQLRKIMQSGMLPLLHAHLFSLALVPFLFQRQFAAGKVPQPEPTIG